MAEWAVYFHLHTAESHTTEQDSLKAAEHADAAAELAQQQGLLEQQVTVQHLRFFKPTAGACGWSSSLSCNSVLFLQLYCVLAAAGITATCVVMCDRTCCACASNAQSSANHQAQECL
jgi:hypothetical protein